MQIKTSNDELAGDAGQKLLRLLAATALAGGAGRAGLSVLSNTRPRYEAPKVPEPLVVDMPYPVRQQDPIAPIPLQGREKKLSLPAAKMAAGPLPPWTQNVPFGETLHRNLPTYTPPLGKPGETNADNAPVMGAAAALTGIGGLAGGYYAADKVLRAADRWGARRDLEDAKKEYQKAVMDRLAVTQLPTKRAADESVPEELQNLKQAIDSLYDAVKSAEGPVAPQAPVADPSPVERTGASLLFPGLVMGPTAARANMAVAALAGLGGGYMGYNYTRDQDEKAKLRKAVQQVDRSNAESLSRPAVARLLPFNV